MTVVSVIIPTLDEESEIAAAIDSVDRDDPLGEVLVADGGSHDRTLARIPPWARIVRCEAGRANQLNAAARVARGEVLLFLHADCRLPAGALGTVVLALQDPEVVGGGFHKRFDADHWLLRGARRRTALWFRLGAMFGDQALFVRREAFEAIGGFSPEALAEDLDLVRRLRRRGRLVLLPPVVVTSARRLLGAGILVTWARWWVIGLRQLASSRRADRAAAPRRGRTRPVS